MKIVTAKFTDERKTDVFDVCQWDYGQVLRIEGLKLPKMVEIHFSLQETAGEAITRIGTTKDGVTDVIIPDSMLENKGAGGTYKIYAWVYLTDADSGSTEYKVTIHVKARSKPEVPGGGDNPDIFHEAVLEVRKSAEKAEEAQKQAEGWAHGREDLPERAEDNAKYYCGKASEDAKKTAEDRKEVERLVESVSGIDEQVAKVEKLSKDAQEAATQAGTSAEQAELHKQAAETASSAAQTAAQETEADRTSVEKTKETVENLSTQVQKNKESVDKTTQDFNLAAQQALADVNNAGQTQTERVQTAGATAVENIKIAQNTATQAVETAKAEAIKTVADKGKEVLEAIPNFDVKLDTKLDKNLGTEHAGKALVIGEDGNVVPGEVQTEGVGDVADAIVNTATGDLLVIKDSTGRKNKGFEMTGKTEQASTTGKNLFLHGIELGTYSAQTPDKAESDNTRCRITEPIKINEGFNGIISIFGNYQMYVRTFKNNQLVAESGFLNSYKLDNTLNTFDLITAVIRKANNVAFKDDEIKQIKIQLEKGTTATAYEPYTGCKPSPSPEYPQEIMNAGRYNEDTGKYEVDVKVTGKNIVNIPDFGADTPDTVKECYISKNICISAQEKADVSKSIWRFKALHKDGSIEHITDAALPGCFYATEENPIVSITYRAAYITSGAYKGIMVEYGTAATKYEPYKEKTLTLTSDRPITKWDKLVEQDGQIGWLYKSEIINKFDGKSNRISMGAKKGEVQHFSVEFKNTPKGNGNADIYVDKYRAVQTSFTMTEFGVCCNWNDGIKYFSAPNINITNTEEFKAWLSENPLTLEYETETTEFVPLPQEQQEAIRALQTYYPTTVVSNSEDAEMQLSYVADTKNYTDRKIEQAVSAQVQNLANLLSLMPLSTQAAMIEADTNNILDMEVQK